MAVGGEMFEGSREDVAVPADVVSTALARFRHSPLPEHQHLCAVAAAMVDVIQEQNMKASPTAYFAAIMAALERDQQDRGEAVTGAMLSLLALVLPKTPTGVLRSKMEAALAVVVRLMSSARKDGEEGGPTGVIKPGLQCLQHLLQAADKSNWLSLARPFGLLLHHCSDTRPKIRKRAQASLVEVFADLQGAAPALALASDAVVAVCERTIAAALAPTTTQLPPPVPPPAGGGKKNKGKAPATEGDGAGSSKASRAAVAVLHMLGALKQLLPLMAEPAISRMLLRFAELYELQQPLLTRHLLDTMTALCRSPAAAVSARALGEVVGRICEGEGAAGARKRDADEVRAAAQALQVAAEKLHDVSPAECARRLPLVFLTLVGNLASEQEEVVYGTAECLRALITGACLDDALVQEGLTQHALVPEMRATASGKGKGKPTAIERICSAMEGTLDYQYSTAWDMSLLLLAALFDRLGPASKVLLTGVVRQLGQLNELPDSDMRCRKQLHAAVGAAIAAMGPSSLLALLPLDMDGADLSKSRVWLLPILRQHTVGASLTLFSQHLLGLAAALRERARKATAEGRPVAAKNAEACVAAVWALLPAVCNYASDTAAAFRGMAQALGDALAREDQLRAPVCLALQVLIRQNRRARGDTVFSAKPGTTGDGREAEVADDEDESSLAYQRAKALYTPQVAAANLAAIAAFSKNFMPLLFNAFVTAAPEKREPLQNTIAEFAAISEPAEVRRFFVTIMQKLLAATSEAAEPGASASQNAATASARRCAFMDLALAMAPGLEPQSVAMLYTTAKPVLQDADGGVQKRAYKLIARLCQTRAGFLAEHADDLLEHVLAAMQACHAAARRHRLVALHYVIMHLLASGDGRREEAVAALLSEITLATKEVNKKTRNEAYNMLVAIGRQLSNAEAGGSQEALLRFFTMVVGGLAGATSHMVGATVVALARLLYEFSAALIHTVPELLPSVLLLLRSKSREVIKAILGLVKVLIARVPAGELEAHLGNLLEGLLLWCEDSKNHFKMKVRVILERLVRRCGYNAVAAAIPAEHSKLLTHIRKTKERAEKKKRGGASEAGGDDAHTNKSRVSTARKSAWNHTDVFSDGDDDDFMSDSGGESTEATTAAVPRSRNISKASARSMRNRKLKTRLPEDDGEDDSAPPLDLLDSERTRRLLSAPLSKRARRGEDDEDGEIPAGPDGRLLISESWDDRRKRRRMEGEEDGGGGGGGEFDDDGDDDGQLSQGGRSRASQKSRGSLSKKQQQRQQEEGSGGRGGGRGTRGKGAAARGGKAGGAAAAAAAKRLKGRAYTGEEYATRRGGKTGGDAAKPGRLEPHAYWPLDPKMLNRREGKRAVARKGMKSVLHVGKGSGANRTSLGTRGGGITKAKRAAHKAHKARG